MQVQLQICFFLWTPQSRGPMRFSFLYRYLEGTVDNAIPLPLSTAADKINVRYIRNKSVSLRLMWCRRSGDSMDQSIPLDRSLVCLTLFGSHFLLNWDRDILGIECCLARVPRSQFCGRWNSKSGTWDWDTRPIAKFCELWTQYPGCFDVCVLLCFIKPILGNRYGPGVTWAHQLRHTDVVTPDQHVMYYITSWISLLKQFSFVLLTLLSSSYPFSQQYHYFL